MFFIIIFGLINLVKGQRDNLWKIPPRLPIQYGRLDGVASKQFENNQK